MRVIVLALLLFMSVQGFSESKGYRVERFPYYEECSGRVDQILQQVTDDNERLGNDFEVKVVSFDYGSKAHSFMSGYYEVKYDQTILPVKYLVDTIQLECYPVNSSVFTNKDSIDFVFERAREIQYLGKKPYAAIDGDEIIINYRR